MLGSVIWHGLGVLCLVGILLLGRKIAKCASGLTVRVCVPSFFMGLLSGGLGVVSFFIITVFASDQFGWISDMHHLTRLCIAALCFILFAFLFGKMGAYLARKYFSEKIIVLSALIAALLLILHPIGYGWLKSTGLL